MCKHISSRRNIVTVSEEHPEPRVIDMIDVIESKIRNQVRGAGLSASSVVCEIALFFFLLPSSVREHEISLLRSLYLTLKGRSRSRERSRDAKLCREFRVSYRV